MVSGGLSSQNGGLLSGDLTNGNGEFTIYELGQNSMGSSNYEVTGQTINQESQYPLGILYGTSQIVRQMTVPTSTVMYQTAAIRFRIHLLGTWTGQPCSVSANDQTLFSQEFVGTNIFKDIELQIPYTPSLVNLVFSCDTQNVNALGWTLSDTGYHFSTCPMEYLRDSNNGGCQYVGSSLFTGLATQNNNVAVQQQQHQDVPAWENGLRTGTTDSNSQIVVVDNKKNASPMTSASGTDISQLIKTYVFLIGTNFDYSMFPVTGNNNQKVGLTSFNGYPVYGTFSGAAQVSHEMPTMTTTKAVALRVRLYLIGSWNSIPFSFQANGSPVYSAPMTGQNTIQDIEIMIPANSNSQPIKLTFGIAPQSGSPQMESGAYPWAVSDIVYVASNAPAGKIYSPSTNGFVSVPNSFFTTLLNGLYSKQIPNIKTQPVWLNKVVSGQFNNAFDIIALNGKNMPLPGEAQQNLNNINILGGNNAYAQGVHTFKRC